VRGADGQVRGVPLAGIHQEGADVVVAYTKTEFDAATPIPAAAGPMPAPAPAPTADPATTEPADPSAAPDPMAPPADGSEPTLPPTN